MAGPIKQVKITQPGPWGSYRFKEIYDEIPGLDNMAWNELAGIELSILVDLDGAGTLNIPCQNIMQRPAQMVGKSVTIRSISDPTRETTLDFLQACLIPAGFGDYEFISPEGTQCTVVMIRLKKA